MENLLYIKEYYHPEKVAGYKMGNGFTMYLIES